MKKTSIYLLILVAISPFFIYTSCDKGHDQHKNKDCKDAMCTMMFAMITAEVKDANGNNVTLDEVYTIRTSTGEKLKYDYSTSPGFYTILDDGYQKQLQNSSDKFQFVGMKGGVKVVDETYTISADCCHVMKQAGNSVITLQ